MRRPSNVLIWAAQSFMFLRRLRDQGARYVKTLTWLISDSVRVAPLIWFRIFAGTLLNLGSNAVVAGAVYTYVNLLQQDAHYHVLGLSLAARESLLLLVLFVGFMILAMFALAASEYVARAAALKLHRRYQEYSVERALRLLQLLPDARCPEVSMIVQNVGVNRLIKTLSHSCSWSLRFIGSSSPNFVVFVAGYGALLWLDIGTTLLVTLLGIGVIAAQYPIHLLAARSSNVVEEMSPHVSRKLGSLITFVTGFAGAGDRRGLEARLDDYARDDRVIRSEDADEDRYRAMELSALSMQTGGGIVLGAMLLTIGSGLLSNSADWAVLLVYATLLRRLLTSVTGLFRQITLFSRFSPHVQIYRSFVRGAALAAVPVTSPPVAPEDLRVAVKGSDGNPETLRWAPGERFAAYNAAGLDRDLAIGLQCAVYQAQRDSSGPMPDIRVVALTTEPPPAAEANLEAAYASAAILLLDPRVLAGLPEPRRSFWLDRLSDRYVALGYPAAMEPAYAETVALVKDRADALHGIDIPEGGLGPERLAAVNTLMWSGEKAGGKASAVQDDMG